MGNEMIATEWQKPRNSSRAAPDLVPAPVAFAYPRRSHLDAPFATTHTRGHRNERTCPNGPIRMWRSAP